MSVLVQVLPACVCTAGAATTSPPALCAFLINIVMQAYLARAGSDRPPHFDPWNDIDEWAAAAHVPLDGTFAMEAADIWSAWYAQ